MNLRTKEINILLFEPDNLNHKEAFSSLNREWIEKDFELEDIDYKILASPEEYLLDKGGYIFFAEIDGKIVGTVALKNSDDGAYELTKFAVTEACRGVGTGSKLLLQAIDFAKKLNAQRIHLVTSRRLKAAMNLYLKSGFIENNKCSNCSKCGKDALSMELKLRD